MACESVPKGEFFKQCVDFTTGWIVDMPVCVVCAQAVCPRPLSTTVCAVGRVTSTGGDVIVKANPTMPLTKVSIAVAVENQTK